MAMTPAEIALRRNQILTNLLLGAGQGTLIAGLLLPRLPQALTNVELIRAGDERLRRYNLRRAPGSATKRIDIHYDGAVYTIDQYAVEVPIPRELLREADESRKLNVAGYVSISEVAMQTCSDVLALDYEAEAAGIATDPANYAAGNVVALAGGTKWSAQTGTPVTDFRAAAEVIRQKVGVRPNTATFSPAAWNAVIVNPEVRGYLPSTQLGPATLEQLKIILNVQTILIGDAVIKDSDGPARDVWGNSALLTFVPSIGAGGSANFSLAQPAFGFTSVMEGHPFAETPYFENPTKSWIYGATYERKPNISYNDAGFLFQNPA